MEFSSYAKPVDISARLTIAKRFWFHGVPDVILEGKEKQFGVLSFDFKDETIEFAIYIKDRNQILNAANLAVAHFSDPEHPIFQHNV